MLEDEDEFCELSEEPDIIMSRRLAKSESPEESDVLWLEDEPICWRIDQMFDADDRPLTLIIALRFKKRASRPFYSNGRDANIRRTKEDDGLRVEDLRCILSC